MQMNQSGRPIDVFRMAGFCRDPTVKRLADLADNQAIVHGAFAQRTEHIRPALRQRLVFSTEYIAKVFPWIGRHRLAQGEIAYWHAEIKYPVWWPYQPEYVPSGGKSHLFATGNVMVRPRNDLGRAVFYGRGNKNGSLGMNEVHTGSNSALFGSRRHTNVSRGLGEFHARRPVIIMARDETMLALPVEGLDRLRLAEFMALCGPVEPQLIITERRAVALGLDASTPMALSLPAGTDANTVLALVTGATNDRKPAARPASRAATAAIQLVKLSQSLPAVLAANLVGHTIAGEESIVRVEADAVADFADHATRSLIGRASCRERVFRVV